MREGHEKNIEKAFEMVKHKLEDHKSETTNLQSTINEKMTKLSESVNNKMTDMVQEVC